MSDIQVHDLKKLGTAKSIPVKLLQTKIHMLKVIDFDNKTKYWFYIGGGSGSGFLLLVVVCLCVYCKCKKHSKLMTRPTSKNLSHSDLENPNMKHTNVGAIKSDISSDFGQETVGIQRSERPAIRVRAIDSVKYPGTAGLLNLLERDGVDVNVHHRILQPKLVSLKDLEANL